MVQILYIFIFTRVITSVIFNEILKWITFQNSIDYVWNISDKLINAVKNSHKVSLFVVFLQRMLFN